MKYIAIILDDQGAKSIISMVYGPAGLEVNHENWSIIEKDTHTDMITELENQGINYLLTHSLQFIKHPPQQS